jgi:hypothetical protein
MPRIDPRTGLKIEDAPQAPASYANNVAFDAGAYIAFRSDPSNDHETDAQWCGKMRTPYRELREWKTGNPRAMEAILGARRSRYADEMIKIDAALLQKAKEGDPKSIQLAWARFENWSPRIEEEASRKSGGRVKTLAELIAEGG